MRNETRKIPVTPFEHFMLADDRATHPMSFCFRLGIQGDVDPLRLGRAFFAVRRAHPLLDSRIVHEHGRWMWDLGADYEDTTPGNAVDVLDTWSVDLRRGPGVRLLIEQREGGSDLWLIAHHACTDGRGAIEFLAEWFHEYNCGPRLAGAQVHEPRERHLHERDLGRERRLWTYAIPFGRRWSRLQLFYRRRPTPIAASPQRETTSVNRPAYLSRRLPFDAERWQASKKRLQPNVTLNDLLLAGAFVAIRQLNECMSPGTTRQWFRLAVPIDLAPDANARHVIANHVSMVFLDRSTEAISRPDSLLDSIHQEMSWIKQNRMGYVMLDILRILERIPFGMRAATSSTCKATSVVSNLGQFSSPLFPMETWRLGEATLTEVDALVPIRPGTAAALGIVTHHEHLHVTLHYDPQQVSASDAATLLDSFSVFVEGRLHPSGTKRTSVATIALHATRAAQD